MKLQTEDILGYPVTAVSLDECVNGLVKHIVGADGGAMTKPVWLACLNPHSIQTALADPAAAQALKAADILVPDGAGIVMASQIAGGEIRERITGSDIFAEISRRLQGQGDISFFFLGSTDETLAMIKNKMAMEFPHIRFVGSYSPPFKQVFSDEDNRTMIEAVNAAEPDILWVGMTAPKQEKWIHENIDKLKVKFVAAVGAVFDFYVGNVKRSHPWFQEHGLEWLPRLIQQPRRLWRRTFISAPHFLYMVIKHKVANL